MKRIISFGYGLFSYLFAINALFLLAAFLGNFYLENTIDASPKMDLGKALLIDLGLILIFCLQHSMMARQNFKKWWRKHLPQPIERSTFVLLSSLALFLLIYGWQPLGGIVWRIEHHFIQTVFYTIFFLGWIVVFLTTFLINHFDLFGLRQVFLYLQKKPYSALKMKTPFLYKNLRHPLYLGFLIAFWASPIMTISHLLFAFLMTVYVLNAIQLEEKDLVSDFGKEYLNYKQKVPMLFPLWK